MNEGLKAWLGPAYGELTSDQLDRVTRESRSIDERYPDPDDADQREAALSAAVQYLLGETTTDQAGSELRAARAVLRRAMAASKQIAAMAATDRTLSEVQAAEQAGIDRMTLLKYLGKR